MLSSEPVSLAAALVRLQRWAEESAPRPESPLRLRVVEHLGADPAGLPVVNETFGWWDRPNLQLALDAWAAGDGRSIALVGLPSEHGYRMSIAEIAVGGGYHHDLDAPVEYVYERVGDRTIACVTSALLFLRDGDRPLLALVDSGERLQVMTGDQAHAEAFIADIRELVLVHNVFKGRTVVVSGTDYERMAADVVQLDDVGRDGVVLPEGVLERIERHTVAVAEQADRLRAAGRHIKRGLLLHGPPGTGKTLTIKYLAARMTGRTMLILTAGGLHAIGGAVGMARRLQPATVVLEDVDLVAMDRSIYRATPVLMQLLNEMDGLGEDADVLFILTTNRPEGLEAALAQRPGRIDQAIELPLPDADGRRRLLALYGAGAGLPADGLDAVVERTEGASPAFLRELLRRSVLIAAERDPADPIAVTPREVSVALDDLLRNRDELTARLLGNRLSGVEAEPSAPGAVSGAGWISWSAPDGSGGRAHFQLGDPGDPQPYDEDDG